MGNKEHLFLFSTRFLKEDEAILEHIVSIEKGSTVASQGFCCGYEEPPEMKGVSIQN